MEKTTKLVFTMQFSVRHLKYKNRNIGLLSVKIRVASVGNKPHLDQRWAGPIGANSSVGGALQQQMKGPRFES
jgi:hypothetical protein